MRHLSLYSFSFDSETTLISLPLKMDTLCVIPYKYIPHKSRRKEDGARSRVQIGTTCYGSHPGGGNDFSRASEIRQTTPNIHNLEDESQVSELAGDDTPKFPDLSDSAIHGSITGNQGRHATSQYCNILLIVCT
jgi:spore coat protein CotH